MKYLVILFAFLLQACSSMYTTSALGRYGDLPVKQEVSDSSGQVVKSQIVEYTYDEVVMAMKKAIAVNGWAIEAYDKKSGKIIGNGTQSFAITFAIYIKEISSNPETKVTIIVDQYSGTFMGIKNMQGIHVGAYNNLSKSFNQILATY